MTGLKGMTVENLIERFYGDIARWPIEPDGINSTQAQIRKVCEHIAVTGDCLWHALSIVNGWKNCHCATCNGPTKDLRTATEQAGTRKFEGPLTYSMLR